MSNNSSATYHPEQYMQHSTDTGADMRGEV